MENSFLLNFAKTLLHWFCPDSLLESIEGDLVEQYEVDLQNKGGRKARWIFLFNVIRFFRWDIISRNQFKKMFFNSGLLISHLKIALRNYRRHFGYTFINLLGLAVAIGVCLVIYSHTRHELGYDSFYTDVNQMYRVNQTNIWSPEGGLMSSTTPPLAKQLQENLAEISEVTRINTPGTYEVRYKDPEGDQIVFRETSVLAADSNFFNFFDIPIIEGDPKEMLHGKNRVVITESTARRYFGTQEPMGEVLLFGDDQVPVIVSGLVSDLPSNMHFDFDLLLSMPTNPKVKEFDWSWIWTQVVTYVKIKSDPDLVPLSAKMTEVLMPQVRATFDRLGMNFGDFMNDKGRWDFSLQPVRDIHLHSSETGNRIGPVGDIKMVRILQILAVLILVIAIINFVNLSTARANIRAREIGVKKTLGATVGELARQFQVESVLMTLVAALLSMPLAVSFAALIFRQTGIPIVFDWIQQPVNLLILLSLGLLTGLLAGIYPSIYLTRLKPVTVMDHQEGNSKGNLSVRNFLVTVQFTISLALLSGGLLVGKQLKYLSEKDLGFERDNILVVHNAEILGNQIFSFRNQVANIPVISNASVSMAMPGEMSYEDLFQREGSNTKLAISQVKVDPYFLSTMKLDLTTGRFFQADNESDKNHVVINETTARLFGWTADQAIGEKIVYPGEGMPSLEIIGVVNDFHFQSLYENIRPLLFLHIESPMWGDQRMLAIKYQQKAVEETIAGVKATWDQFAHQSPLSYSILDEDLNQMYEQESQLSVLVSLLSMLSIFTAILGLIGLVSYTVDQKRKEIGIRKVLGATVSSIFLLVNQQYVRLFVVGLIISIPVTWWLINRWLQDFAFHIDISWYTFLWSGFILLSLCIFSVGLLIYRSISRTPVEAIRDK